MAIRRAAAALAVKQVPLALTLMRALLAPVVILLAIHWPDKLAFGMCLVVAFLSDVFDGILARRLKVATPNLRRLDSMADTLFYVAATFAAWHLYPAVIKDHGVALAILAALEGARYMLDLWKFGREASYHMWSSKLWGITLFCGFFSLLALGRDGFAVDCAIYVGILADLEGLAISIVLKRWRSDVPSIVHACRLQASDPR
jgi:CDP-diacylglycerol--glycerol-3-phosphate 3-phosphatidyltransferase